VRTNTFSPIPSSFRAPAYFIVAVLIAIQFLVLVLFLWKTSESRSLSIHEILLPILYFNPLIACWGFKRHLKHLKNKELLSDEVMNCCNGWITFILIMVYGVIFGFGSVS
jgi:hypothetical protein